MRNFFSKILLIISAFLLMLFPSLDGVINIAKVNSSDEAMPKIATAIETKNVEVLQELMCKNIKENIADLPTEIQKIYDCIDGEILEVTYEYRGGSSAEKRKEGTMAQTVLFFYITTTTEKYSAGVTWETINTVDYEETGIRSIGLAIYDPPEALYSIVAPSGTDGWHD